MAPAALHHELQAGRPSRQDLVREYLLKARSALDGARSELTDMGDGETVALAPLIGEVMEGARALQGPQPVRPNRRLGRPRLRR